MGQTVCCLRPGDAKGASNGYEDDDLINQKLRQRQVKHCEDIEVEQMTMTMPEQEPVVEEKVELTFNQKVFTDDFADVESDDEEDDIFEPQYKNQFEKDYGISITKASILNLLEEVKKPGVKRGRWIKKLNTPDVQVFLKQADNVYEKTIPMVQGRFVFKNTSVPDLMRLLHDNETRQNWDQTVAQCKTVCISKNKTRIIHTTNNSPVSIVTRRDFLEKKVKFTKDDKVYMYTSQCPNEIYTSEDDTIRGTHIMGIMIFEQAEEGTIFTMFSQNDPGVTGTLGKTIYTICMNAAADTLKKWHVNVQKVIDEYNQSQASQSFYENSTWQSQVSTPNSEKPACELMSETI